MNRFLTSFLQTGSLYEAYQDNADKAALWQRLGQSRQPEVDAVLIYFRFTLNNPPRMTATIYAQAEVIGYPDLRVGDESMGHLYGTFCPEQTYSGIRETVWLYNDHGSIANWPALRLSVALNNGYFLLPAGGITLSDMRELPNEPIQVDIAGVGSDVIQEFFNDNPSGGS